MKKTLLKTTALACCFVLYFAATADLSGKWVGKIKNPNGGDDVDLTYIFKVDGNKLTGTLFSVGVELPIDSGKINGNDFIFSITNPEGVIIPHKGKYYGDSIGMDIDYQGMKFHSTLKKADN